MNPSRIVRMAFGVSLLTPSVVGAGVVPLVDQDNQILPGDLSGMRPAVSRTQVLAQTVTVGVSGVIAGVDLQISKSPETTSAPVELVLLRGVSTIESLDDPSLEVFRTTVPIERLPILPRGVPRLPPVALTYVDLIGANIAVQPGDRLAIVLSRDAVSSPPWVLWDTAIDRYDRGELFFTQGSTWMTIADRTHDAGFRLWVVPEPAACSAILFAICCVSGVGLRRNVG